MIFDNLASDVGLQLLGIQGILAFKTNDPKPALDALLTGAGANGLSSLFTARTNTMPAWYVGFFGGYVVYWSEGTNTIGQTTGLLTGYATPPSSNNGFGTCPYLYSAAMLAYTKIVGAVPTLSGNVTIFGHSLGAGIAQALHKIIDNLIGAPTVYVKSITYGGPRAFVPPFSETFIPGTVARLMNQLDPVPLLPPTAKQAPLAFAAIPPDVGVLWSSYCHTDGGVVLYPNGQMSSQVDPAVPLTGITSSVAQWLLSMAQAQTNEHSPSVYAARLALALQASRSPPVAPIMGPAEQAHALGIAEVRAEQLAILADTARAAIATRAQPVVIPPQYEFTWAKQGTIWVVLFQGEIVAVGPNRPNARKMARAGNRLIRSMMHQGSVDLPGLFSQMEVFFGAASEDGSGISPTIEWNEDVPDSGQPSDP
jgi:hypothetical protein